MSRPEWSLILVAGKKDQVHVEDFIPIAKQPDSNALQRSRKKSRSSPKLNNHFGASFYNQFLISINERMPKSTSSKQTSKQASKQTNKHEHQWTPMNTHDFRCIPVITIVLQNNAAGKSYFQRSFSLLIYHFVCLVLPVFNSNSFVQTCFEHHVCFSILCWFGTKKNYSLPLLQRMFR